MNNAKIGNFIRTLRKEKNLTQKELAEKLDITDRAISRWERGIGCPDISLLEQLANTLDISILELLKGEKIKEHNHPNELDLLESMSLSKNNTLNKFKTYTNYFTIITITLFILFILITNLKSILLETKTFHFKDFYEQPTEKTIQKLNNQIELILTNQGIYSKEDYSTIKTYMNMLKDNLAKQDNTKYLNQKTYSFHNLLDFYLKHQNLITYPLDNTDLYPIILSYNPSLRDNLINYYQSKNFVQEIFFNIYSYLEQPYYIENRLPYNNYIPDPYYLINYIYKTELILTNDIIEAGEIK